MQGFSLKQGLSSAVFTALNSYFCEFSTGLVTLLHAQCASSLEWREPLYSPQEHTKRMAVSKLLCDWLLMFFQYCSSFCTYHVSSLKRKILINHAHGLKQADPSSGVHNLK